MHLMTFVLTTTFLITAVASADNRTAAISPLSDGGSQKFTGEVSAGGSQSFAYKSVERREVLITIEADNETCGAELRRDTERGFMPNFRSFPTTRSETVGEGETLKVSFFQTRLAALHRAPCQFSLTVR